ATVADIRERSRNGAASLWQVALDRTAFYPTSGGQPYDTGSLRATAPSGATLEAPILEVEEDEQGEVWHLTPKPLLAGTAVEATIDPARRRDHMQQHSGQHLLSALFNQELNAPTVSFHLGDTVSTIDLATPELSTADLARTEQLANAIVAEGRPIAVRTISSAEAQQLLAAGQLRKLPPRDGDIRLVVIPGDAASLPDREHVELDLNACGGTHVASTSQIGPVLIRGTERIRQSIRVSFLCGDRALASARIDDALLTQLGRELSVARPDLPAALARLKSDTKAAAKERQALREELANYHAARLLVEDQPEKDLRIVRRIFADRDVDYTKLLASRVTSAAAHTIALLASTAEQGQPATLVISCSKDLNSRNGSSSKEPPVDASQLLRTALASVGGRGGGSPSLAQGLVPQEQLAAVLDSLESALRS
ncbi:MAG: alanyl-tRNA synthetase, partial [Acidobacteriaceae bacterium]|nr:alanyl-tRNA synthetase [Acidobacteriaceae bacterium]